MEPQKVIISDNLQQSLSEAIAACQYDQLFVLVDTTTERLCLPVVADYDCMRDAQRIVIPDTDTHKTLDSVTHVWSELQRLGATRHSLMINLGGGMVTDLGGFAASTFKRGIQYINIPTTLLSMVDASVGGKTGFNFGGLKNEIGVFSNASSVILDTTFLRTMDRENLLSGYAEMLKHGLISNDRMWAQLLAFLESLENLDHLDSLAPFPPCSPKASPSSSASSPKTPPSTASARPSTSDIPPVTPSSRWPLSVSPSSTAMPSPTDSSSSSTSVVSRPVSRSIKMRQTVAAIKEHYGRMPITCDDYPQLLALMHHDKKNTGHDINFTLLGDVGDIRINQTASEDEIRDALDFYREC